MNDRENGLIVLYILNFLREVPGEQKSRGDLGRAERILTILRKSLGITPRTQLLFVIHCADLLTIPTASDVNTAMNEVVSEKWLQYKLIGTSVGSK